MDAVLAPDLAARQRDAFLERMLQSCGGAFEVYSIHIGDRLGYYRALSAADSLSSAELAEQTGTCERYAREWLEQQAAIGILQAHRRDSGQWRFDLPEGHAEVLTDTDSPNYLAPLARVLVGAAKPIDALLDAFRTGDGVPFEAYGTDLREGQCDINRVAFLEDLPRAWIPAMPDVQERLRADPPAGIADIGCGGGWSSIGMAQHFPKVRVDGYDLDAPSIDLARTSLSTTTLEGRVRFHCRDAADSNLDGHYDLVTAFECVHDMSDPVSVLRTMRRLAGDDGAVLVVDERVADEFSPQPGDVDWMMYGWSVLHCLPVGMAEKPSAETGTVLRAPVLRRYASEAGFRDVDVLPVDNFFFRLYRLRQ